VSVVEMPIACARRNVLLFTCRRAFPVRLALNRVSGSSIALSSTSLDSSSWASWCPHLSFIWIALTVAFEKQLNSNIYKLIGQSIEHIARIIKNKHTKFFIYAKKSC